eukprot:399254-Rhodomonas_salina.1
MARCVPQLDALRPRQRTNLRRLSLVPPRFTCWTNLVAGKGSPSAVIGDHPIFDGEQLWINPSTVGSEDPAFARGFLAPGFTQARAAQGICGSPLAVLLDNRAPTGHPLVLDVVTSRDKDARDNDPRKKTQDQDQHHDH